MAFFYGCSSEEDFSPIITFDKAGKGGYPRLVQLNVGELDLNNLSSAAYSYEVEFVTIDKGENVTEYRIDVEFIDNNPDNGDDSNELTGYRTFTQSDFSTNADGFRGIAVEIPLADVAGAVGVNTDNLAGNDIFSFTTVVTLSDGQVFTSENSTAAVNGSAFQGYFDFPAKVTCPLPGTFLGDYELTYKEEPTGAFGAIFGDNPGTVSLVEVPGSTTRRQIALGYLADSFGPFDVTLDIDFVCENIFASYIDTGVGCGGSIGIAPGEATPFDFGDDTTFEINLIEYDNDGGCGTPLAPVTLVFTKI